MPRLNSQLQLFGWGNRNTPEGSSIAGVEAPTSSVAPQDPARALERLCQGPNVPAILKPLTPTIALITQQLLQGQAVPAAAAAQLAAAAEFLKPAESVERQLEHALHAHTDKVAMRCFMDNVGAALSVLCQTKGLPGKAPPLKAALAQWQRDAEAFMDLCRDIWELHAYFVFLDVKGDRALLETTALQLCASLGCSMRTFMASAARTGPWVQETLGLLAEQRLADVLAQRHVRALQQWRAMWQERLQQLPQEHQLRLRMPGPSGGDGDKKKSQPTGGAGETRQDAGEQKHQGAGGPGPGCIFWENYFNQLFIVAWPDFAEALEDHFFLGRCPTDILKRLRQHVPKDSVEKMRTTKKRNPMTTQLAAKKTKLQFQEGEEEEAKKMMTITTMTGEREKGEEEEEELDKEELDKEDAQQVSRSSWQRLLQEHEDSLPGLADALLGEVLADVSACIFRKEPLAPLKKELKKSPQELPSPPPPQTSSAAPAAAAAAAAEGQCSMSSTSSGKHAALSTTSSHGKASPVLSHAPAALAALASATTQMMAKTKASASAASSSVLAVPTKQRAVGAAAGAEGGAAGGAPCERQQPSETPSPAVKPSSGGGGGRQQHRSSGGHAGSSSGGAEQGRRGEEEASGVADTTSATPLDPHRFNCPIGEGQKVPWGSFLAHLHAQSPHWWSSPQATLGENGTAEPPSACYETASGSSSSGSSLAAAEATVCCDGSDPSALGEHWEAALRAVSSSNMHTKRAIILRVVSGDLARGRPLLLMQPPGGPSATGSQTKDDEEQQKHQKKKKKQKGDDEGEQHEGRGQRESAAPAAEELAVPTAIPPAGSVGVSSTARKVQASGHADHLPALVVTANGTRFNGITKFGRGSSRKLLIPDLAMSEPIASRSHFNVVYEAERDCFSIMDAGSKWGTFVKIIEPVPLNCGDWIRVGNAEFVIRHCGGRCKSHKQHRHHKLQSLRLANQHFGGGVTRSPNENSDKGPRYGDADSSDDDTTQQLHGELKHILSGHRRPQGWHSTSTRIGQSLGSVMETQQQQQLLQLPGEAEEATASPTEKAQPAFRESAKGRPLMMAPVPPLEIDFISGPRMGEKIVLTERICTLGRGEGSTVQVSDPMLANVSRTHCIFEYSGDRWRIRDNGSTNGTWRRLSCVLVPSKPIPLKSGMSLLAGVHEFLVEEAEMPHCWLPSMASVTLAELCEHEQHLAEQACPQIAGSLGQRR